MKLSRELSRQLAAPAVVFLLLLAAGIALIWTAQRARTQDQRNLAAVQAERRQAQERLIRLAHEEREVRDNIEVYRRLKELRIIGEERRLEWIDALGRIRSRHELLELRYQVERQKLLKTLPGNPAGLELRSSTMNVELALLHEGDLIRFLGDLRASGNAYYSVRRCSIHRSAQAAPTLAMTPRLRSVCQIDLITLLEIKAKT